MKPSGIVAYEGPSAINGAPVVAIITFESTNRKTGPMAQLWILPALTRPTDAIRLGLDDAVCGDCPHRGPMAAHGNERRTCYVNAGNAPQVVYRTWRAGGYLHGLDGACDALAWDGAPLRLGAYGDPGALPLHVIDSLCNASGRWTGYTHQWRARPDLRPYCMASVDSSDEADEAAAAGWRYFLVVPKDTTRAPAGTIWCPSDKVQCHACRLCAGTSRPARSIAIRAHGPSARFVG